MDNQSEQADPLNATTTLVDGHAVITIIGEVDSATCDILTSAAHVAVDGGAERLTFDLAGVEFFDSSGLSALITTRAIASVTLRNPSDAVRRLIDVTGLTDVFAIEP